MIWDGFRVLSDILMASGKNWTENEILAAIDLYVQTPFGKMHSKNPEIIELASNLGRTPGSIALKLVNLASMDDSIPQKGMANASKLDRIVWDRFFHSVFAMGAVLPPFEESSTLGFFANPQPELVPMSFNGNDIPRISTARQGQQLFRKMVLASYDNKCGITGISQPELLIAGHIRKWSEDKENRLNPQNGICLNRLHDRAFESNLIAFEDDGKILYSKHLGSTTIEKMKRMNDTGYLTFPRKFAPKLEFLQEHREAFRH